MINLIIDSFRIVTPTRFGGHSQGETWSNYYVYSLAEIFRVFRFHPMEVCYGQSADSCEQQFDDHLTAIILDYFSYGSCGPGQTYARRPSVRRSKCNRFLLVNQNCGLDV